MQKLHSTQRQKTWPSTQPQSDHYKNILKLKPSLGHDDGSMENLSYQHWLASVFYFLRLKLGMQCLLFGSFWESDCFGDLPEFRVNCVHHIVYIEWLTPHDQLSITSYGVKKIKAVWNPGHFSWVLYCLSSVTSRQKNIKKYSPQTTRNFSLTCSSTHTHTPGFLWTIIIKTTWPTYFLVNHCQHIHLHLMWLCINHNTVTWISWPP